jgi:holo-[acyl-carrier protein] synthase
MNVNAGIDIVEISRIRRAVERWGERFLKRVFTVREREYCGKRYESLAARFAAKEACAKALSKTGTVISWLEVEVLNGNDGKPYLCLHGAAEEIFSSQGKSIPAVSLSHCREYAVALVIDVKQV